MHHLTEIPVPTSTYFVGMLYPFQAENKRYVLGIKSQDLHKDDHIKTKLPGGSGEKLYEDYFHYENALFDKLTTLKFEKKAQKLIYRNEIKRKKHYEAYGERSTIAFLMRALVLSSLEKVGYYPVDLEPMTLHYDQKGTHTQYFMQIEELIDRSGEIVVVPQKNDGFSPLGRKLLETRLFLDGSTFTQLIHAHKVTADKYFVKYRVPEPEPEEED